MKSSHAALVVVGLSLVGLWYAAGGPVAPQSTADARVSEPVSHENLTVFFVHGPDAITGAKIMTLQEALETGRAVVHETGEVNTLSVDNLSADYELFIQDGDMVRGGRQDRLIAIDMLVPPRSGKVPLPAHCVESGRWTNRGGEDAKQFNKSDQFAVGNELRYANAAGQQGEVWKNVKLQQDKLSDNLRTKVNAPESETSLQLALENRVVQAKVAEFERVLRASGETRENVIGVVFVLNGEVYGHEEYGSNELFRKAWPKLLRAAAASAVAEKPKNPEQMAQAAPSVRQIERFLAYGAQAQPATEGDDALLTDGVSNQALVGNGEFGRDQRNVRIRTRELREQLRADPETRTVFSPAQDSAITGGSGSPRIDTQRLQQIADSWSGQGPQDHTRVMEEVMRDLPPRYREMVEEYFRQLNRQGGQNNDDLTRAIDSIRIMQAREEAAQHPELNRLHSRLAQPDANLQDNVPNRGRPALRGFAPYDVSGAGTVTAANVSDPQGNRLNVNRVGNAAGLVSEARDPARQNAVIHKSFIKK